LQQHEQTAATQQQKLQAVTQQLQEVQQRLQEALAAAADAKKQRDEAVQLQSTAREQLNTITATHKVGDVSESVRLH
jgi:hypothetical protein